MPKPITFTTEAERLKAREQYVAIRRVIGGACAVNIGETFDAYFPPIAPPKMVPFEAWVVVDKKSGKYDAGFFVNREPAVADYLRAARVRVVEVDNE